MRSLSWALCLLMLAAGVPAAAQETRGNISGTVRDQTGVIPGATVKVTNVDTGVSQTLITNSSGYYNAPLLQAGNYQVGVEMPGFKTTTRSGVVLSVGQQLDLGFMLEVGGVAERVDVVAEAPLLDTSSVASGQNFDQKMLDALPMYGNNMPVMLVRFSPGIDPNSNQQQVFQGFADGTTNATGSLVGGIGSNNFTIDGANNNGSGRRVATSPNSDMIQEMRVETSNFDAAVGHGVGATIAMMTRAGTNALRGTANYQYWTNALNALNIQQEATFAANTSSTARDIYDSGRSHVLAFTLGGPLVIPRVVDGRNKLFFFANFSKTNDSAPGKNSATSTIPYGPHLDGDFSDLLTLPAGSGPASQYQIYDPLTVRADPARPGKFIRTPFPNNIIPKDRFMNPDGTYKNQLFGLYRAMLPQPNQNFITPTQQPTNNYFQGAQPDTPRNTLYGGRIDWTMSPENRFFFRGSGSTFIEGVNDWTYEAPDPYKGLHSWDQKRYTWAFTGNWTHSAGATVIDTQLAANEFFQAQPNPPLHDYTPTSVGLPVYMDDFCKRMGDCRLPLVNIGGYQEFSRAAVSDDTARHVQGQVNVTHVAGTHTLRAGVDLRNARRIRTIGGATSGQFNFDNTYTRAADTTTDFPAQNLGLSLAALMLGIPSTTSIVEASPAVYTNQYYGAFAQDQWRIGRDLTLNVGLRFEYENGIKEEEDRMLTGFDDGATLAITQLAESAYTANPDAALPASQFRVRGGSVYAETARDDGRSWAGEAMWMPRVSAAYKVGEKTVLKGGWGLYYDTLNAGDFGGNQFGYSVTTTNSVSTDFGRTWLLGDPKNGISPLADPFPVRLDGNRFETPVGSSLGVDSVVGTAYSVNNLDRTHERQQRWRISVQRELTRTMAIEIAYNGSYADQLSTNIRQDYLPEPYWNGDDTRNVTQQNFLQANIPNPFRLAVFAPLQTLNPALYQRMAANPFFQATTTQRNRILRAFPQFTVANNNGLTYAALPLGESKARSLEFTLTRRYSNGLSANAAFAMTHAEVKQTVHEYDRAPTLWQLADNARPYRITAAGIYELPFGEGKPMLSNGGVASAIAGGWTVGGTYEYQPGALIAWGNPAIFFHGDINAIAKGDPEVALLPDGTTDLSKTWFNVDAGFERDPLLQPAAFQKVVFPFRIDNVRGGDLMFVNMNVARTFDVGSRRTFQFRVDIQNLLNRQHWGNPNVNPINTNFGRITTVSANTMRFITFVTRLNF